MKIIDKLNEDRIHISFEVFPPKTDAGFEKVKDATDKMVPAEEQVRIQRRLHHT